MAGIALGGLIGLFLPGHCAALPERLRQGRLAGAARSLIVGVAATALGLACYLAVIGGLVWLIGLVLGREVTGFAAMALSIVGLFGLPFAYALNARVKGHAGAQRSQS